MFVATTGPGSMDGYSQRLVRHLDVETIETDIYHRSAELFDIGFLNRASLRGFALDLRFVRLLRSQQGLVHLPNHHLARYGNFLSTPYVVTVHDLIRYFDLSRLGHFIRTPSTRDRLCFRLDYAGISRAAALISVSETTKRDLVAHLGIPEERIFVVYEGVDHDLFRPVEARPIEAPYVLFVGSEQPRKNLPTLFRAFAALRADPRFRNLKLVKVGNPGNGRPSFRERTLAAVAELGLEDEVIFTGRVPHDDLPAYYSGAGCLVLPSFYEGFGLPPLEAMACGCPVIVSTRGALPEIAGGAALTVEPQDVEALATAMKGVFTDPALRAELRARGLERASHFSWEKAARETVAVYETVRGTLEEPAEPPRPRLRPRSVTQ